jgi:adenylate cyclase
MSEERVERRLAAILAADVAGYSRLMGEDEAGTLARLHTHRRELIDPQVAEHKGRIVKTTGDGILIEFPSVVEAVACAVAVQRDMAERNTAIQEDQRMEFRIGINLGDVIVEDDDIHGDGVNIAARLEGIAEPGEICVSAVVRDQVQGRLDCAFDDLGEQVLKNIVRPVRAYGVRAIAAQSAPQRAPREDHPILALPDKPSIAVLPFQNMSGDPEQEYFADGMVEEIITALSRIRWLFVIARNSSFTYKGQTVDVKRVGRELGVRYVLEGSVRKGGNRVRITAQLIEAETGAHLWADRFDGALEDIFDLQDQVASSVAGVIEPTLQAAETARSVRRPTQDLSAYDFYLRALDASSRWDRTGTTEALNLAQSAIDLDSRFGAALALAAVCHLMMSLNSWEDDPDANRRAGVDLARRALRGSGDDPYTLVVSAYALGYFGEDLTAAIALVDRALDINPSFSTGWYYSGQLRMWAGQHDLAFDHFTTSVRLSPNRTGSCLFGMGVARFFASRFEEAKLLLLRSIQEYSGWAPSYRFLASCCAHLGELRDARKHVEKLRALTSVVVPDASHWRRPEDRELFLSGLRMAMGATETHSNE